ncbi:hypothetical protein ACUXCC_002928 [Cytobacillus horneckiae]|nr:hypothetical protein [Cytobacillus horneckiae]MBN6887769.1 hypothetical protein [Cytobacillus horneckiae]
MDIAYILCAPPIAFIIGLMIGDKKSNKKEQQAGRLTTLNDKSDNNNL